MSKAAAHKPATDTVPNTENGTVIALCDRERTNQDQSRRQYLTEKEVAQLCDAAHARGRWGHRDATMILIAFQHGLRAGEPCDLQWHQVELAAGPTARALQAWLGHRNIQHTVRYTELAPDRFKGFWRD